MSATKDRGVLKQKITDPGRWFAAFEHSTNQKIVTNDVLTTFLKELLVGREGISFLDIGCSSGQLAGNIITSLRREKNITYYGVDPEVGALEEGKRFFLEHGIESTFKEGDCFLKNVQETLPKSDVVLISHVAYYANDIADFSSVYAQKSTEDGVTIFIHDALDSDINQLRTKYNAAVQLNTACGIEETLGQHSELHAFSYKTLLQFPKNMNKLWDKFSEVADGKVVHTHIPNFQEAKHLLEFVVQQPLEDLQRSALLDPYLTEIKEKLGEQENCLHIRSRLHIAVQPEPGMDFSAALDAALSSLESRISELNVTQPEKKISEVVI